MCTPQRSSVGLIFAFVLSFTLAACDGHRDGPQGTEDRNIPTPDIPTGNPTTDSVTSGAPSAGGASAITTTSEVQVIDRMLTADQLPPGVREVLQISADGEISPSASGSGAHPFTTKRASSVGSQSPVRQYPWRATGKLIMTKGASSFVCTASVIGKNLLVTAAHCVHEFGQGQAGFVNSVSFEPARHEASRPFGTWAARQWWVPTSYFDGTDVCNANAPGVVCENDIAVVVLEPLNGQLVENVTGKYDFSSNSNYGFIDFLGKKAAQITQLGYPLGNYDGDKMIRTDSLGYHDVPMNIIIGSNQTGGSSGGPWLQNFGTPMPEFTGDPAFADDPNMVVATTSWGFNDGRVKVQGGSRFSRNTAFTQKTNIQSLIDQACSANPDAC